MFLIRKASEYGEPTEGLSEVVPVYIAPKATSLSSNPTALWTVTQSCCGSKRRSSRCSNPRQTDGACPLQPDHYSRSQSQRDDTAQFSQFLPEATLLVPLRNCQDVWHLRLSPVSGSSQSSPAQLSSKAKLRGQSSLTLCRHPDVQAFKPTALRMAKAYVHDHMPGGNENPLTTSTASAIEVLTGVSKT